MNRMRTLLNIAQRWNAVLPLCAVLLAIAMHSGFQHGDVLGIIVSLGTIAAIYTIAPFMDVAARTSFAPLLLGLVYTCVPYVFTLLNLGILPQSTDYVWLIALYLLGAGNSALQGADQASTKKSARRAPALVARYGKDWTCFAALGANVLGSLIIIWQVRSALWLVACVALFLGALAFLVIQLADTPAGEPARVTIIGIDTLLHGLLVTISVAYICIAAGASAVMAGIATGMLTAACMVVFFWFVAYPGTIALKQR
jgi:hypothetical protein